MRHLLTPAIAVALLTISPIVHGQTVPDRPPAAAVTPVTPPQSRINLTVEQRHTIKELIKDLKVPKVAGDFPVEIGSTVPQTVSVRPIPPEVGAKVPQVKSHEFFLMDDRVVLVSPKDNKVADIIE